jgi:hypothetical protein
MATFTGTRLQVVRIGDDPRWQTMLDFVNWALKQDGVDGDEFARRLQEDYIGLAQAIAADRAAPRGDRASAGKILAEFGRVVQLNAPAPLATTARLVRDPNTPAETRAEFAELLARAVEGMPAASNLRH